MLEKCSWNSLQFHLNHSHRSITLWIIWRGFSLYKTWHQKNKKSTQWSEYLLTIHWNQTCRWIISFVSKIGKKKKKTVICSQNSIKKLKIHGSTTLWRAHICATFGFHKHNCFYINKWKRDCNYKLNCLFQTLSHPTTLSSAQRNCHSKYTHNDGHKGILEDCKDISLELGLHYIHFRFLFWVLLLYAFMNEWMNDAFI